jgi:hypothetical protein
MLNLGCRLISSCCDGFVTVRWWSGISPMGMTGPTLKWAENVINEYTASDTIYSPGRPFSRAAVPGVTIATLEDAAPKWMVKHMDRTIAAELLTHGQNRLWMRRSDSAARILPSPSLGKAARRIVISR